METKKKSATKAKTSVPSDVKRMSPIRVGNKVFVRTVTYHYTGEIVAFNVREIVLEKAAWIAYSGRFAGALASGMLSEVEPYPEQTLVSIERSAVVDVCSWSHELPRSQK